MSNNVWVEATLRPDSITAITNKIEWPGLVPDELHVTLAFTNLHADEWPLGKALELHQELDQALTDVPALTNAKISGFAVFDGARKAYGVVLVNDSVIQATHSALAGVLGHRMNTSIAGFTPHITIGEGFTNHHDVATLSMVPRMIESVKFDGTWLRVGRMCLPL